ncbi:MAG TPA: DUF5362 family protein [Chitinophagaceae bacterium]|nr:DUF5362 family protein [Chitinophagaceae bacterium]
MEPGQNASLFEFGIDTNARVHLSEAARWAKFLAVFGMIMCGVLVIIGVFAGTIFSSISNPYGNEYKNPSVFGNGLIVFMIVLYVGIAVLYFFPCLFLLRFANHMRNALNTNDQHTLNSSFQNLKIMFRYMGMLTIVVIALYILAFLFGVMGAAFGL